MTTFRKRRPLSVGSPDTPSRLPEVYTTKVKQTNTASAAAEYSPFKRTLRQKYGSDPNGLTSTFIALAEEIWDDLEGDL